MSINSCIYIYGFIALLLFSLNSCTKKKADEYIAMATEVMYSNPDSAQFILDHIDFPNKLTPLQYSEYLLVQSKIHRLTNVSIKNDTLLLKAIEYFKQTNNIQKLAESYLEAGRVFEEKDSITLASTLYLNAFETALKTDDERLKGFSAYDYAELLEDQLKYSDAIFWFNKAKKHFSKTNSKSLRINTLRKIADNYVLNDSIDQAIIIYEQSLKELSKNSVSLKPLILKNMAVAYNKKGEQEKAKFYIKKSISSSPNNDLYPIQHLILSDIFRAQNQIDSADYYQVYAFKYATELHDPSLMYFAYNTRLDRTLRKSRYLEARYDYWLYRHNTDSISQKQKYQTLRNIESLYNQEKIKRKEQELIVQKQRFYFLITLIILVGFAFFIFYYKRKHKQIKYLHSDIEKKEEVIDSTKSVLIEKLNIYKKMTTWYFSSQRSKYEKLLNESNKLIFEDNNEFTFNIEVVSDLIDSIYDKFVEKLKSTFPELTEIEFQICILSKAGFNVNEIAEILNKSTHTIYKYNSHIRKKIGVPENKHILDYLDLVLQK